MPTPRPIQEEPEALRTAWEHVEGVKRVKMASVTNKALVHGEVITETGKVSQDLAEMLLAVAQEIYGSGIIEMGVILDDEDSTPFDFMWTARRGGEWRSAPMVAFQADRLKRRGAAGNP